MRLQALVILLPLVACQTYDFERVVPLLVAQTDDTIVIASKRLKPNVMLLIDKSGSMKEAINDAAPNCTTNCGESGFPDCPASCPTRMSEMRSAMSTFLANSGTVARLGATIYPAAEGCTAPTNIDVALPPPTETDDGAEPALATTASEINRLITGVPPLGGTPTGQALAFLGTYAGLGVPEQDDFRQDYVLLLTDGLPNCNDANPNAVCSCGLSCTTMQTNACACTSQSCAGANCARGCLDQAGAVDNVKALRQGGIRTIVVGFGAALAQDAGPLVLNAMAQEGGVPRQCPNGTDAECGGTAGSCNTTTSQCSTAFYQAANGAELAVTLRKILEILVPDNPCTFVLKATPSDERYLSVLVDGQNLTQGPQTYSYDFPSNTVTFQGAMCDRITASTPQRTVSVEFRIVERF